MITEKSGTSVMVLDKKQINFDQNHKNLKSLPLKEKEPSKLKIASQTMPDFQKASGINKVVIKDQHETNTFNSRDTESSNNHSSLRQGIHNPPMRTNAVNSGHTSTTNLKFEESSRNNARA
mgnify:CR=1 FL=1